MKNEILENIKQFVYQQRWKYKFPLERTTQVEADLGIAGDDALEFILAYSQKFNVDISQFILGKYFNGEGWNLLGLAKEKYKKTMELTLGDLEKGIIVGKLDEEVITSYLEVKR